MIVLYIFLIKILIFLLYFEIMYMMVSGIEIRGKSKIVMVCMMITEIIFCHVITITEILIEMMAI